MLGMDLELRTEFKRCSLEQAATSLAIVALLVQKGIVTYEEFERAKTLALQELDQAVCERDENVDNNRIG